jgi:hypothetical protein
MILSGEFVDNLTSFSQRNLLKSDKRKSLQEALTFFKYLRLLAMPALQIFLMDDFTHGLFVYFTFQP